MTKLIIVGVCVFAFVALGLLAWWLIVSGSCFEPPGGPCE